MKKISAAIGQRVIAFFLDHRRTLRFYKRNIIMNAAAGLYRRDRREQQKEGDGNRPATAKNPQTANDDKFVFCTKICTV